MKKQIKCLLLAAMLLMCAFGLCACHGSQEKQGFTMPTELDTSRIIEITFWAKNDTNKNQTDIYEQAVRDFEALYPSIKVNIRLYTDYSRIYNDVITNISTGTTPNVCITYPDHIATYLTGKNVVVPLDSLMSDAKFGLGGSEVKFDSPTTEEIVPQFLAECKINDTTYALPYMRSTEACYVNKTFVEKLGYTLPDVLTWDFVWEVSEAAMAQDADGNFLVNGQKVLIPFIYKSTDNMMIQFLHQKNAAYSNADGEILLFNDTTSAFLKEIYAHAKTRAFSTFKISSYPANFLNAGQCIFAVDSTAGSTWMGSDAPLSDIPEEQYVEFETAVRTIPQEDPEHPSMISQGPSMCLFYKEDSQEVLASWLFMQYLLSNDVQTAYAETEGYVPVTLKAQNSAEYQDYLSREGEDDTTYYTVKLQASKLLLNNMQNTFVTPVFNGSASLRDAAGQLIENAAKAARRKQPMEDENIQAMYADVTSLYRLDQLSGTHSDSALPTASIVLLASLVGIWILILVYKLKEHRKAVKKAKN